MKKLAVVSVLVVAILIGGCNGSSGSLDPAALEQAFVQCSQGSVLNFLRLANLVGAFLEVVQGGVPPSGVLVDFQPGVAVNEFDFDVTVDTNGNGAFDTQVQGTALFSDDPTDGINVGSDVDLTFTISNAPTLTGTAPPTEIGPFTGNGTLTVTFAAPNQAVIEGTVSINDSAAGCNATLTFADTAPINLVFPDDIAQGPLIGANVGGLEIFGQIQATLRTLGRTLEALITLAQGSQTANVNGSVDGTVDIDADFELFPDPLVVQQITECGSAGLEAAGALIFTFAELTVFDFDQLVAGGVTGVTLTPVNPPTVFNYAIDLGQFGEFSNGTLNGQVTVALNGDIVTQATITWTLATSGILVGGPTITGSNDAGRPLVLNFDAQGDFQSLHGAGTLDLSGCTFAFDIPISDPLIPASLAGSLAGGVIFNDGRVDVTVTVGEDVLRFTFDVALDLITNVTLNGVPVPPDLLGLDD